LGFSRPFDWATRRRRDTVILSRIYEKVRMGTIILKEEGDSLVGWFPRLVKYHAIRPL